jgi:hypothetical protein
MRIADPNFCRWGAEVGKLKGLIQTFVDPGVCGFKPRIFEERVDHEFE